MATKKKAADAVEPTPADILRGQIEQLDQAVERWRAELADVEKRLEVEAAAPRVPGKLVRVKWLEKRRDKVRGLLDHQLPAKRAKAEAALKALG